MAHYLSVVKKFICLKNLIKANYWYFSLCSAVLAENTRRDEVVTGRNRPAS